jgi:hypothetical protein
VRWISGFPFLVDYGAFYPTNWDIEGWPTQIARFRPAEPLAGLSSGALPIRRLSSPLSTTFFLETRARPIPLRGDGDFSWDTGLDKEFHITERARMQFRRETFNITNSIRGLALDQLDARKSAESSVRRPFCLPSSGSHSFAAAPNSSRTKAG